MNPGDIRTAERARPAASGAASGGFSERLKINLGIALILVSAGFLYWRAQPRPPFNPQPHQGLGQAIAAETAKIAAKGGKVTLIVRDSVVARSPAIDVQKRSFADGLKAAGFEVGATNIIKVDPLRVTAAPSGDFLEILRRANNNDVVVSFLGPPVLTAAQLQKLGGARPKVIALCSGAMPDQINLRSIFDQQLLSAAIVERANPAVPAPGTENPRAWFDALFQVITPANLNDLPIGKGMMR